VQELNALGDAQTGKKAEVSRWGTPVAGIMQRVFQGARIIKD
jgi:hypothetical protein